MLPFANLQFAVDSFEFIKSEFVYQHCEGISLRLAATLALAASPRAHRLAIRLVVFPLGLLSFVLLEQLRAIVLGKHWQTD
jgi:hypothetical protein